MSKRGGGGGGRRAPAARRPSVPRSPTKWRPRPGGPPRNGWRYRRDRGYYLPYVVLDYTLPRDHYYAPPDDDPYYYELDPAYDEAYFERQRRAPAMNSSRSTKMQHAAATTKKAAERFEAGVALEFHPELTTVREALTTMAERVGIQHACCANADHLVLRNGATGALVDRDALLGDLVEYVANTDATASSRLRLVATCVGACPHSPSIDSHQRSGHAAIGSPIQATINGNGGSDSTTTTTVSGIGAAPRKMSDDEATFMEQQFHESKAIMDSFYARFKGGSNNSNGSGAVVSDGPRNVDNSAVVLQWYAEP